VRRYEAMVIFPGDMDAEQLNAAVEVVRGEIETVGGRVENVTRLGKRTFARVQQSPKKMAEGYYCLYDMWLAPDKVDALRARLALRDEVYRVQIVRTPAAARGSGEEREASTAATGDGSGRGAAEAGPGKEKEEE